MPQLRKDPVIGRWVIIASERARRPGNFIDTSDFEAEDHEQECSFCNSPQKVIYTARYNPSLDPDPSSGDVRVVLAETAGSQPQAEFQRERRGLYDVIAGVGSHEIVIESPKHLANMADLSIEQIRLIFETYAVRIGELEKNEKLEYALAYKNYGPAAGSRHEAHTRSHIIATPVWPIRVKEKLIGAKNYFDLHQRCIYCDLINQEIKSSKRVVLETEHFIAITPFAGRYLFELCVLPKDHHCDYYQGVRGKEMDLAKMMKDLLQKLQQGLDDPAYNFVIQTAPFPRHSLVRKQWGEFRLDFHWHIELMPRLTRMAGFEKGTGFYICAVSPEDVAQYLREVEIPWQS
jgi:UDPglucose--hexose-1-phosphate uridylyltransferase